MTKAPRATVSAVLRVESRLGRKLSAHMLSDYTGWRRGARSVFSDSFSPYGVEHLNKLTALGE